MEFADRSNSSNGYIVECVKEIDHLIDSTGLADFSDKYYQSSGYPCFLKTDPSLQLLWILVGGSLDKATNTVFRYLESDSIEPESCKLSSLTLGSIFAAGDPTLLERYVLAYSTLLDIAVASKEDKSIETSYDNRKLIGQFIQNPYELVFLGSYDSDIDRFTIDNQEQEDSRRPSNGKGVLSAALWGAVILNPLIGIPAAAAVAGMGAFDEKEPLGATSNRSNVLLSRDGDFERLAFKTCFYERIISNLYKTQSKKTDKGKAFVLKVAPQGAKYGCVKTVKIDGRSFEVNVPPGSNNNTILRLKGVGAGGSDVLLTISTPFGEVDLGSRSSDVYKDVSSGSPPIFSPSAAIVPVGQRDFADDLPSLLSALGKPDTCVQSFFNDLQLTSSSPDGISLVDDVLQLPPFDECLYARLVTEMHRYTLAELYDQRAEVADKYSYVGAGLGGLLSLITGNPLLPFAGGMYGRNFAPKGKKLEEILPNPQLLFEKDRSSFTSMIQSGVAMPKLRRLIFHRVINSSGNFFFRLIPAIVSADSIIPAQVFRCGEKAYFIRPINAGIDKNDPPPGYYPMKIHKQYYHLRGDGKYVDTGQRISVVGDDIEGHQYRYRIYRHSCDTRELDYFYIDYASDPSHVF